MANARLSNPARSGFLTDDELRVLTCFHVCGSADDVGRRTTIYGVDHINRGDIDRHFTRYQRLRFGDEAHRGCNLVDPLVRRRAMLPIIVSLNRFAGWLTS